MADAETAPTEQATVEEVAAETVKEPEAEAEKPPEAEAEKPPEAEAEKPPEAEKVPESEAEKAPEAEAEKAPEPAAEKAPEPAVNAGASDKVQGLVLNAGSSSLKYALFDINSADSATEVVAGLVEKIGLEMGSLKHEPAEGEPIKLEMAFADHKVALAKVIELLTDPAKGQVKNKFDIRVVGHRVVHGGESFTSATLIDDEVLAAIREAAALAPLHNPANISGIEVAKELFPDSKQVAVFDTAFHLTMPPEAFMYAIPKEYYKEQGIRRYGFHGSSYTYVLEATSTHLGVSAENINLIVCHLGNGASMAAIKAGKCVDTTMGLTPLDGLVMGTRSGDIDPAIHHHLFTTKGMSPGDVNTVLNKKSGLQGLCGDSDMRNIQKRVEEGDEDAKVALGVFIKRIRKYLGSFLVTLGGKVDAIVFTAGIGENSDKVRELVCEGLDELGIALDKSKNSTREPGIRAINSAISKLKVLVVPTNEELSITMQSVRVAKIEILAGADRISQVARVDTRVQDVERKLSVHDKKAMLSERKTSMTGLLGSGAVTNMLAKRARRASAVVMESQRSVYLVSLSGRGTALVELGLYGRLFRLNPSRLGYFRPISNRPGLQDTHVNLIHSVYNLRSEKESHCGVDYDEAIRLMASGKQDELVDKIIARYEKYRQGKSTVLISGLIFPVASLATNFTIAEILRAPVLFTMKYDHSAERVIQNILLHKQELDDTPTKIKLSGVIVNRVPLDVFEDTKSILTTVFAKHDIPLAGVLKQDECLNSFRINELHKQLGSSVLYGEDSLDRFEAARFVTASGSVEDLLAECCKTDSPCVVLVGAQRGDIILALLFAMQSSAIKLAGLILTGAVRLTPMVKKVLETVHTVSIPVLMVSDPMEVAVNKMSHMSPSVLPSSTRKIEFVETLFDTCMNDAWFDTIQKQEANITMTPKLFQYQIFTKARTNVRHIVLPEGNDKRVVAAAAELTSRGLAKVTLMGNLDEVNQLAGQMQASLEGINIIDPATSPDSQKYADILYECRKSKGMTPEKAIDLVMSDPNYYGTLMMYNNDADGMVSGACHTTADTMRPALQIIKTAPGIALVSSVFFMLLPEKVYIYGDCAINVNPDSTQLANIAVSSADTAIAFGIRPRVALLSYATGESNKGDLITKVREASEQANVLVEAAGTGVPIEGPLQFDAAVDPEVAKVKIKTKSEVAGQATVCIFPDLNTGNNAYKAVQQASDCVAMGPIMQGLKKPVNDLSRGCTVDDIVNTVVITCIQSMA